MAEASKKDKGRVSDILMDLFGQEHLPKLQKLVGGFDKYREDLNLTAKESNFLGSMQKEFEAQAATTKNQLQLLKNASTALAINFGTALLPGIKATAKTMGTVAKMVISVQEKFPELTSTVTSYLGILLTSITVFKAARMGIGFFKKGLVEMYQTIKAAWINVQGPSLSMIKQKIVTIALASDRP